jgi:HEAT repeat protein
MYEESAIWALISCLQQADEDLRLEAASVLAEIGPRAAPAIPALRAAERDESADLRAVATLAIAKIRPEFSEQARAEEEPRPTSPPPADS